MVDLRTPEQVTRFGRCSGWEFFLMSFFLALEQGSILFVPFINRSPRSNQYRRYSTYGTYMVLYRFLTPTAGSRSCKESYVLDTPIGSKWL